MKVTIKAKVGYRVRYNKEKTKALVFDGESAIMGAEVLSYNCFLQEMQYNEQAVLCEVFETVKGNKFVYFRDEEIDADYIAEIPN